MCYPNLEETLAKVLTTNYQISDEEANRIAEYAAKKDISRVHVAGSFPSMVMVDVIHQDTSPFSSLTYTRL